MSSLIIAPIEVLTDTRLNDRERRVLLALYSFRNKNADTVFPSLESLADRCQITDIGRISKTTKSLSNKGWLTKKKRGFTGCNQYTLMVPEDSIDKPANLDEETNLVESAKLGETTQSNLAELTQSNLAELTKYKEQQIEQQIEHKNTTDKTGHSRQSSKREYTDDFETVWKTYPKRAGDNPKVRAFSAYKARLRSGITHDQILRAVKSYAADKSNIPDDERQFIKQTATFLGPDFDPDIQKTEKPSSSRSAAQLIDQLCKGAI